MTTEILTVDIPPRLTDVVSILTRIRGGDYTARLANDLPADHPLSGLYAGLNELAAALEDNQERGSAYRKELEDKLATIDLQRMAIRELSTPIMEVWASVLCLPVIGVLDSTRSAEMMEALLRAIVEKKARYAIIDITGIQVIDTATADHFIRMAKAVRLLGAECSLTGINPNIAQTIVHMGVELSGIVMHRSLRSALQQFVGRVEASTSL